MSRPSLGRRLVANVPAQVLAMLCTSVGCHAVVQLVPPDTGSARGMVLLISSPDGYGAAFGVSLGEEAEYPVLTLPHDASLEALLFPCPILALGLREGRLELRTTPAPRPLLPEPEAIVRSKLQGSAPGPWQPERRLSEQARGIAERLPLPDDHLCTLYGSAALPQTAPFALAPRALQAPRFLVRVGQGTALAGTFGGELFLVRAGGSVQELGEDMLPPELSIAAAHHDGQRTWLVAGDGAVAVGTFEEGFLRLDVRTSTVHEVVRVDGARADAAPELFLVSSTGYLEHFDGTAWTILHRPEPNRSVRGRTHDVAWIAPGEALATGVGHFRGGLVRYSLLTGLTEESLPTGAGSPISVGHFQGLGTFVGTDRGRVARLAEGARAGDSNAWEIIDAPRPEELAPHVRVFAQGFGELLFGGAAFARYHPSAGACALDFQSQQADELTQVEEGSLLVRPAPALEEPTPATWGLTWLRTAKRTPSCLEGR